MVRAINQTVLNSSEFKLKISCVRSINANDIPKITKTTMNEQFEQHNDYNYNRGIPEQEILPVIYEKSEPVLNTESSNIYYCHKKNNKPKLCKVDNTQTSTSKKRIFTKKSVLQKYERKHNERDDNMLNSKIQSPRIKQQISMKCEYCDLTFTKLNPWRKHYLIHQSELKCMYCPAEFILLADLEMHEAICFGVLCTKDKSLQTHKHMTRSARSSIYNDNDSRSLTISGVDTTMHTQILYNVRNWIKKTTNNYENVDNNETKEQQLNYNDCESPVTTFSRVSSRLYEQFSEREEDSDIVFSQKNTSLKNTINRLKTRTEQTGILNEDGQKHSRICKTTLGNYGELINCPDKCCNFITTSMERLLEHDLTIHDELPLFPCKKCGGRFLRRIYLEEHLSCQNPGRFVCSKCEKIFNFERELKYHLIDHEISDSKKNSKHCKVCNLTFTQSSDYCNHIISINHIEKHRQKIEQNIPRIYYKNSSFNIENDNKQTIKLNRLQPYTKETKILQNTKPFKTHQHVVFRQWKPHMELMRLNGANYYDCAIKPYT